MHWLMHFWSLPDISLLDMATSLPSWIRLVNRLFRVFPTAITLTTLRGFSRHPYGFCSNGVKGSRRNKFRISGVEAPVWQGAQVQAYRDFSAPIVTLGQRRQAGCIGA
jgi:hypothetical protein